MYDQSHILILHRHVSATTLTIITVPYNKHTINVKSNCKKFTAKSL